MEPQEIITMLMSLLAVLSSFYAVWVSRKNSKQKVKLEFLQEQLDLLKKGKEDLQSSPESNDIVDHVHNQMTSSLKVIEDTSALFPETTKKEIRKRGKLLDLSYARLVGEKWGIYGRTVQKNSTQRKN